MVVPELDGAVSAVSSSHQQPLDSSQQEHVTPAYTSEITSHLLDVLEVADAAELDEPNVSQENPDGTNAIHKHAASSNSNSISETLLSVVAEEKLFANSSGTAPTPEKKSKLAPKDKPKRIRRPPEFKVTHDYHDSTRTTFDEYMRAHPNQKPAREVKTYPSFPKCLHAVLDYVRATDSESIVSWQPHGRAFIVHEPEAFAEHILPLYFRQTK